MVKLAIVGPQFADPMLFGGWFARRHGFKLQTVNVGEVDRALVAEDVLIAERTVQLHVLLRACWDVELAHKAALEGSDHVLVTLCRSSELQHLNREAIEVTCRYVQGSADVVVAINDPFCGRAGAPDADLATITSSLPRGWKVHATKCGDFYKQDLCDDGVSAVFEDLLGSLLPTARIIKQ